jgi:O-antigen/teichoic acid export membrane protein
LRCLSEGEYGTLEILNRLGEVVLLCLLFNGLRQALLAFYNQAKGEAERRAVLGSALCLTLGFLGLGAAGVCLAAEPISERLDLGGPGLLRLAVVSVFLEALSLLFLALAQARVQSVFFAVVSFGQFIVRVVLCIVLVALCGWGVEGVLLASCVASGIFTAWLLVREVVRGGLRIDPGQLKAMFWFALPFVPGGLGFFVLNSGDRFFLLDHASRADLGAYALGYKLAVLVQLFSRRPLYQVWNARMYEAAGRADAPIVFGRVTTRILAAYVGVGLALCLVADEVVLLLGGGGYLQAGAIIAPVTLAYFFLTAADLMDAGFYVRRRTAWKTPVVLGSTAATLALYALLIPAWGIHGAALATLFGFVIHAALTQLVVQRIFPVRHEWGRLSALLGWAAALWLIGLALPSGWWMLPLKAGLWLLWPIGLWMAGVVSDEEKEWAREAVQWPRAAFCQSPSASEGRLTLAGARALTRGRGN